MLLPRVTVNNPDFSTFFAIYSNHLFYKSGHFQHSCMQPKLTTGTYFEQTTVFNISIIDWSAEEKMFKVVTATALVYIILFQNVESTSSSYTVIAKEEIKDMCIYYSGKQTKSY